MTIFSGHNFITNRSDQTLRLAGRVYSASNLWEIAEFEESRNPKPYPDKTGNSTEPFLNTEFSENLAIPGDICLDLQLFLQHWFDGKPTLEVKTSGSTGQAKIIEIEKEKMINSAIMTCSFFELGPGNNALLCMPLEHIGAKMMVVRALVAGFNLHLAQPTSDISAALSRPFDFVSLTPHQAAHTLDSDNGTEKLNTIRHLLLGGMPISADLETMLDTITGNVWHSYGMTETISHVALRKVNNSTNFIYPETPPATRQNLSARNLQKSSNFTPLDGVTISLASNQTLIIKAPHLANEPINTNDLAVLNKDGTFSLQGRIDNIINSGGVKIFLEELEDKLSQCLKVPLQITSLPDKTLGEKVVLLLEDKLDNWQEKCQNIPKHWLPKAVFVVEALPQTANHKPNRREAKLLALKERERSSPS